MRPGLLETLACPACLGRLRLERTSLVCAACGQEYGTEGSVPVLLDEEGRRQVHHALEETASGASMKRHFTSSYSARERLRRLMQPPQHWYDIDKGKLIGKVVAAGRVLEIGSGAKRLGPQAFNMDIYPFANVDVVGDAHKLPFASGSFDGVVSQAVMEHLEAPSLAVDHIYRVLRPGGLVYVDLAFMQHLHGFPFDYYRWTLPGLEKLFQRFEKIETGVVAGPSSLLTCILRDYAELIIPDVRFLKTASVLAIGWLTSPIRYLDRYLSEKKDAHRMALSLYYLGRKPEA